MTLTNNVVTLHTVS